MLTPRPAGDPLPPLPGWEAPAVPWLMVASVQSSQWVSPRPSPHPLPSSCVSGSKSPAYKRTPVLWTPAYPNDLTNSSYLYPRAHLQVRPHPQGRGSKDLSVPCWKHKVTHQRAWERSQHACKALSQVSVGLALQAWWLPAALSGLSRPYMQGFCPGLGPAGVAPAGQAQPEPAESLSLSWKPPASVSCYSVGPSAAAVSLPPPPSCSGRAQVPTRDRRLGRGNEGLGL